MTDPHGPDRHQSDDELLELIAARCDGIATPEQWQRLSEKLVSDPAAADLYVSYMTLHAGLTWLSEQPQAEGQQAERESVRRETRPFAHSKVFTFVAAVVLLIGVGLGWSLTLKFHERPVLAWMSVKNGDPSERPMSTRDHLRQEEGESQLRFVNGVNVTVTGKADLEVIDGMNVILHAGQVQVDVGTDGRGFTVKTPSTDVIDLGTVFGVSVIDKTKTDIVVFSGEVQLENKQSATPIRPSLFQGEAVRISAAGERSLVREIWMEPDGRRWSTQKWSSTGSPILSVSDNRTGADCSKYYTIVPRGFGEDVAAYGDRDHEWNSLPGIPLPQELTGADYIRTFNDTKFEDPLEIVLSLSMPANIYILMDERFDPPEWLIKDYSRTDLRLGLDVKNRDTIKSEPPPPLGTFAPRHLGKGPGISVDVPFVVWKRTTQYAQDVHLGKNGTPPQSMRERGAGSMYGIVVTPASQMNVALHY